MKAVAEKWIREPAGETTGLLTVKLVGGKMELSVEVETYDIA